MLTPFVVTGATVEDRLTAVENYFADWSKKCSDNTIIGDDSNA